MTWSSVYCLGLVMYPHRIRLRGPWEFSSESLAALTSCQVTMPARWVDLGWTAGPWSATVTRRFGLPRILDSYEHVFVTCAGFNDKSKWFLNGESCAEWSADQSEYEFEVTDRLLARNELRVEIESDSAAGGLWGEVGLEIRGSYFLKHVAIRDQTLDGVVIGEPEAQLELYVICDGRTVCYEQVTAAPTGARFSFNLSACCPDQPTSGTWRVELIEGANRWFSQDLPAG